MYLKLFVWFFLLLPSFGSLNFEFLNMHNYFTRQFFALYVWRHACQSVNRGRMRERTWSIIKSRYKQMYVIKDYTLYIGVSWGNRVYQPANERMWLEFSCILQGSYGAEDFANAGPLNLRWIIVCFLITLQGSKFNEMLPKWSSMDTIGPELVWNAMLSLTSLYTSTKKTKMWFGHPDPEEPAFGAEKADGRNL